MENYIIRKASIYDMQAIRDVAQVAFPATYASILTPEQNEYMMDMMYSEDVVREELTGSVTYLLLESEGTTVGYVSFEKENEEGLFHLHKIYLLPDVQGKGYGKVLFQSSEDMMKQQGARAFELNVNRYNKALGFYERMGMRIDRSGDFDIGDGYFMNDYIMRKEL